MRARMLAIALRASMHSSRIFSWFSSGFGRRPSRHHLVTYDAIHTHTTWLLHGQFISSSTSSGVMSPSFSRSMRLSHPLSIRSARVHASISLQSLNSSFTERAPYRRMVFLASMSSGLVPGK